MVASVSGWNWWLLATLGFCALFWVGIGWALWELLG